MEFFKEYILTIILAIIALIMLFVIYNFVTDNGELEENFVIESNENIIENEENEIIEEISNENEIEENIEDIEDENIEEITEEIFENTDIEENQMKQITLEEIANEFNTSDYAKKMIMQGYRQDAVVRENTIIVTSFGEGIKVEQFFYLDNNILYTEIKNNEIEPMRVVLETVLALQLFDSVGQLKGYTEGKMTNALNEEISLTYTVENEGVEFEKINENTGILKIDLNSEFLFLQEQ